MLNYFPCGMVPTILSFFLALILTPLYLALARRLGITAKGRGKVLSFTPTGGGVALYLALIPGMWMGEAKFPLLLWIFGGAILLFGFLDDLFSFPALFKLLIQVVIVALWVSLSGVRVEYITHPLSSDPILPPAWLGGILSGFWILLLMNAWNLVDGMDGLAPSLGIISLSLLFILDFYGAITLPPLLPSLLGALLAFLPFNLPPARLYLGNAGSYLIGFLFGSLTAESHLKGLTAFTFFLSLALFALPVGDLLYAVLRRFFREPRARLSERILAILKPDEEHTHHLLEFSFRSKPRALLFLVLVSFALGSVGLLVTLLRHSFIGGFLIPVFFFLWIGFFILLHLRYRK
jgi:UDP-GlcNAc:undecaprenyl-phosphate GlcNAc-1-phosphate transferase